AYTSLIYENTTTRLTPSSLHALGHKELTRIHREMELLKTQSNFQGTLKEFQASLRDRSVYPELFLDDEEAILEHYKGIVARCEEAIKGFFERFPRFRCQVLAMGEGGGGGFGGGGDAVYFAGTEERPGTFMINVKELKGKPLHQAVATCLHE
ncbi:hypothetical protein HDU67_005972, partial [Dinochytrium kinnereticum]